MSLKTQVGIRIKALRKRKGLTQEELARLSDRSIDAISALERGLVLPGFDTLERLAAAMGASLPDFLEGLDSGEPTIRSRLRARLTAVVATLPDDLLEVAVDQIEVLGRQAKSAGR